MIGSAPSARGYACGMSIFNTIRSWGFHRGPARLFGGICGGIARHTNTNVWLVRVLTLLLFALPVLGWGAYAVIWIVTPNELGSIPLERWLGRR